MISSYIDKLKRELITGSALEHSYRPALKALIESLNPNITAVNDPSRSEYGAPDFIFLDSKNKNLIHGYAETKDINVDLNQVEKTEQLKRYLGYSNLILTNYLEFRFFRNGEKYQTLTVAKKEGLQLKILNENFSQLERELQSFLEGKPERINNAKRLSEIMGGKAARIRANIINFLQIENEKNNELLRIYKVMQKLLVHDLKIDKFADMYAQTLVYGLFVARYYDNTPDNFSRQEARDLIPASNPFLQHFFDHIIGPNFDKRLTYIVDELCDVFTVSDVRAIIQKHYNLFGEAVDKDPIIHFYEDFLKEYDPKLRKEMGAYYTPVPIVSFIIHAVEDILKSEFNLPQGLASTEKIERQVLIQGKKTKQSLHKVQILDPAVGTATFLNEIVKFVYKRFKGQEGLWKSYVENELLPRLYGFELMMAPYTIAHLKLAMTFKETGIDSFDRRIGVYLTNTLEEGVKIGDDLFSFGLAEAISEEAKSASTIKSETPIMVVLGNPPYSGISSNMTEYATSLVEKYKIEPGGKEKLKERKHWLNDDYVKFIAFAEKMIDETGEGIVAMITNHGYLDNPTFRGMRWHLASTFSSIYVLDLHGSIKKLDTTMDGNKDENVFDIQQGVAIIIGVKNKSEKQKLARVYRGDLWGRRKNKFEILMSTNISRVKWSEVTLDELSYAFIRNTDVPLKNVYKKGVSIAGLFPQNVTGIVTMGDGFIISKDKSELKNNIETFIAENISEQELKDQFNLGKNYARWILKNKEKGIIFDEANIRQITYRPFDDRWIYFNHEFVWRKRNQIMRHFLLGSNIGIVTCRQSATNNMWSLVSITNKITDDSFVSNRSKERGYIYPLYIYRDEKQIGLTTTTKRTHNLDMDLVRALLININKYEWTNDHENKWTNDTHIISPLDILDYVYATLYSLSYRESYKDFLKEDFPRIPPAQNKQSFWALVKLGGKLRRLHLMEDPELTKFTTSFSITGDNIIEKAEYHNNKVFINTSQYFDNVSKDVWGFYLGGYQPAQKWLKDRKGKKLDYEGITHYQKMINSLEKTIEVMQKIDEVSRVLSQ